ncbi:UNVERIFIED_CONTAM: hypothetical protein PYX00_003129 [Menopon gallinae]|uniref:Superoxide dismutase n=1 Tax=Menopon gallinae TaxID=328185 RepID=A0AAW2HYY8_9NEOP
MFAVKKSVGTLSRTFSVIQANLKHTLPEMPYPSNALEPVIKAEIMEIHHQKHHATYVNNLNAAEEKLKAAVEKNDVNTIISLQPALKFNGGGHLNHSIFWTVLAPPSQSGKPSPELASAINCEFCSMDKLKEMLSSLAVGVQGSGWAWLGYNPVQKRLELATCANQDPLQATTGLIPLFGIDVWEHAYYLQYKNVRAEYVKNIWEIVNWKNVSERYAKAIGGSC